VQDRKFDLLIATFSYAGNGGFQSEYPAVGRWLTKVAMAADKNPHIGRVVHGEFADTPIPMCRNAACEVAIEQGFDLLLMVDSDMRPDLYVGKNLEAKPFWDSSFAFWLDHFDTGPCYVFAPYCGPPPDPIFGGEENVYVFQWANKCNSPDNRGPRLAPYTREQAAMMVGFWPAGAGPTGLCLLDVRGLKKQDPFWFDYEYEGDGDRCPHCRAVKPGRRTKKCTTEDVFFFRNAALADIPSFCNWDAWAGHMKPECVGKPILSTTDSVRNELLAAAMRLRDAKTRLRYLNPGKSMEQIERALQQRGIEIEPAAAVAPGNGEAT